MRSIGLETCQHSGYVRGIALDSKEKAPRQRPLMTKRFG